MLFIGENVTAPPKWSSTGKSQLQVLDISYFHRNIFYALFALCRLA